MLRNIAAWFYGDVGSPPHMAKILPNLWLGPWGPTRDEKTMQAYNIKHVINLSQVPWYTKHNGIRYVTIDENDVPGTNLAQYFRSTHAFISQALNAGEGVYVHCMAGVSRSATIVLAYLIQEYGWSYERALAFVKRARPHIKPNVGFQKQLLEFSKHLAEHKAPGGCLAEHKAPETQGGCFAEHKAPET